MTPHDPRLSRRSVLAALGAVGTASVTGGFATTSVLTDTERVRASLAAGAVDLRLGVTSRYAFDGGEGPVESVLVERPEGLSDWQTAVASGTVDCASDGLVDGDDLPVVELADLKPGDRGRVTTSLHVCANPAYLRVRARVLSSTDDRTGTDALERAAGDTDPAGELAAGLRVRLYVDGGCDGAPDGALLYPAVGASSPALAPDPDEATVAGLPSLADLASVAEFDLDGPETGTESGATAGPRPFPAGAVCVTLDWWLPRSVGNEAVTDAVTFTLEAGATQARHNDGTGTGTSPFAPSANESVTGASPPPTANGAGE
jgi:hypothetical protein